MTEKQKMISGELYLASNKELIKERSFAKSLTYKYNLLKPSDEKKKYKIIKKLFGKTGKNFWIESPFQCDYGYNIEIGENFYSNHNCVILDCAKVKIGDNVFFGPNVGVYTAGHPLQAHERNTLLEFAKPITIGNNVWIGGGVSILPGVTIGDNAVIGSGSVITKDIPSDFLAFGNPCKPIREITEKDKMIR